VFKKEIPKSHPPGMNISFYMENNFRTRLIIFFAVMVILLLILGFTTYYTLRSIQMQFAGVENKVDETYYINNLAIAIPLSGSINP